MGNAKRDNNYITTLLGVSNVDGITPVALWVDPVTHRLLVSSGAAGDVVGPASSTNNNVVFFDGITGKLIKDSGLTLSGTNTGDQDLSGLVPYTGATGAVDLGNNNFTVDTNTLFIDSTNNRVGFGTTTPLYKFDVLDTNEVTFRVISSHNIGAQFILKATGTGGNDWRFISGANSAGIGGGAFGFFNLNVSAYRFVLKASGEIGLGVLSPTARAHIAAGTTTTPPLKLTSGTNLTTPEAGSMEFDGTNLYFSPSTTRKTVITTGRTSTETSSATPSINTDNVDFHSITALAVAVTSMTTNLTGSPVDGQVLKIRFKDNGTARAITWGAKFVDAGQVLPTTTVISKLLTVGFIYDSVTALWGCVAVANQT